MKNSNKKALLFIITMLFWFGQYAYVPYMSQNLTVLGCSATVIGLVAGGYGLIQLLFRIPLGMAADLLNRQKIFVIIGMAFNTIAPFLMIFANSGISFLLLRALSGFAASSWASYTILYASYYDADENPKAIGHINMSMNIGRFFSFTIASVVAAYFGMRAPFIASAIASAIGLALTFFVFETKLDRAPIKAAELFKVGLNKQLLVASFLSAASQFIVFATALSFVSDYAVSIGAADIEIGLLTAAFVLPMIVGSGVSGSFIHKKYGDKKLIGLGFILLVIYCLGIPMSGSVTIMYIFQLIGGIGNGVVFSLLMSYSIGDIAPEKKSTAMGFFQAVYSLGMMFGPIIMGVVIDFTELTTSFYVVAGFTFVALLSALYFVKGKKV